MANSEDPDGLRHFITICIVYLDKIDLQRKKIQYLFYIPWPLNTKVYVKIIVSKKKEESISRQSVTCNIFVIPFSHRLLLLLLANEDPDINHSPILCQNLRPPLIVGHPEPEKKVLLAFLSTFWHPCSKCILMCFKKDRGGCQVWKCPKVPELGQRSTECKLLYIRQILSFVSISYPKLWFKVMQNLFWIIQTCFINKQHHQGMMCVWIKGHLSAKSVKIVAIFYLYRGKIQILSSLLS